MGPAHLRQEVGQRPADDHRLAARRNSLRVGQDVGFLQHVPGEADDLGRRVVIDSFPGVLVADRDAEVFRRQGGQGEQAQGGNTAWYGVIRRRYSMPQMVGGNFGWTRYMDRRSDPSEFTIFIP